MESANLTKLGQVLPPSEIGELILQNGRQAGTRRPLGVPTTFIGRSQGSDIRLNIDGVDPMHCVLVYGPDGLSVRDLDSSQGTYVNGDRVASSSIRHGDTLKIGPSQFRVELSTSAILDPFEQRNRAAVEMRQAVHVQAAAIAAQQIALEDEEGRLVQRQSDLQIQEDQLARHFEEKQRQVQMWTEHTKAERESLRKQKAEQQKILSRWEQELNEAKEHLGQEQQQLIQEKQRIGKVYQRLRHRWYQQWTTVKEKYQGQFARLEADAGALAQRQTLLSEQETSLAQEMTRFKAEREEATQQLQESWDELKKNQQDWRRQQVQQRTHIKARQEKLEDTTVKMNEARQLLLQEKESWEKQQEVMQKELHGLNNRVLHQREKIKEQEQRLLHMDQELHTRLLHIQRVANIESAGAKEPLTSPATPFELAIVEPIQVGGAGSGSGTALIVATLMPTNGVEDQDRHGAIERLAGELADQRLQLIEQYKRMVEIQESWTLQREQAAQELEAAAQQLLAREQALTVREETTRDSDDKLQKEREELLNIGQEIEVWRGRLKVREQTVEQDYRQRLHALRQQATLLQEQLGGLTELRQRWNRRRQEEVEHVRAEQGRLKTQREELLRLRHDVFQRNWRLDEEKRVFVEKALAAELYRQEMMQRVNDPAVGNRLQRLRRRWIIQNAALIRNAKRENEAVRKEAASLTAAHSERLNQIEQVAQADALLGEKLSLLEERQAELNIREQRLTFEAVREGKEMSLTTNEEIEQLAKMVYEEPGNETARPIDKAA